MSATLVAVENLVIDGESDAENLMSGCDEGESGFHPPFAIFSPDLQHYVGGPYASRDHAQAALDIILNGLMVPTFTETPGVIWTVNGKPSPWYDED